MNGLWDGFDFPYGHARVGKRIPFLAEIVSERESMGGMPLQKKSRVPISMYRDTGHGLVF